MFTGGPFSDLSRNQGSGSRAKERSYKHIGSDIHNKQQRDKHDTLHTHSVCPVSSRQDTCTSFLFFLFPLLYQINRKHTLLASPLPLSYSYEELELLMLMFSHIRAVFLSQMVLARSYELPYSS